MHSVCRHIGVLLVVPFLAACTLGDEHINPQFQSSPSTPALNPSTVSKPTSQTRLHNYTNNLSAALRMHVPRAAHSATLLADGQVLIAGGFRTEGTSEIAIASAELYDPATDMFQEIGPDGNLQYNKEAIPVKHPFRHDVLLHSANVVEGWTCPAHRRLQFSYSADNESLDLRMT